MSLPPGFVLDGAPQQAPSNGPVYGPAPIPEPVDPIAQENLRIRQQAEARQAAAQQQQADLAERKFAYEQQKDAAKSGTGEAGKDPKQAQRLANLEALTQQINRVQQLYDENLSTNTIPVLGSLWEYLPTPTNRQFDSAAAGMAEQGLASFRVPGVGAQSDNELRQFVEANRPSASDSDEVIQEKLRQLRGRVDATRREMGLPPAEWRGVASASAPQEQDDPAAVGAAAPADGEYGSANPTPPQLTPGGPEARFAEDYKTVNDPQMEAVAAEYRQRLANGEKASTIIPWLRSQGMPPQVLTAAMKQIKYRQENPDVPIENYSITTTRMEPMTTFESVATGIGASPVGAYALGAGQFLSGNTLDNLSSDPEAARIALDVARAENPNATLAGEISGGVMAALTGEAGLARLGMASGLGRGAVADTVAGAANGAGAADDGNRLTGAAQGGLGAAVGSAGGTLAMRGAGRALNPSGGRLADLYAEGVRPTPGQRFAESGVVGRAINATEEALQSVPIVGAAISGARQESRDQFQVGAFNQALREIGEELPAGMKPGTDPHKYAQEAFSRIYDEARSGMRVVADEQLANELSELGPDIATLGPAAQNKLKAIMANTIKDDLSGDTYKRTMSDLGKHIARLSKSAMGEEQQLAEVLTGIRASLDNAARRHSDPEAVALLDKADAGYAKLVRIEEAAARRGGEAGTFTPNNFDSSVQKTSGGVRSKAYLRGDAQMQDYANQGKTLSDKMANSGTTDRALAATTVAGGAAYVEPTTLGILASIGAAYAPGVRKAVKKAMAPSSGKRRAIAERLKRIERITGAAGAAAGAQAAIPGQ